MKENSVLVKSFEIYTIIPLGGKKNEEVFWKGKNWNKEQLLSLSKTQKCVNMLINQKWIWRLINLNQK